MKKTILLSGLFATFIIASLLFINTVSAQKLHAQPVTLFSVSCTVGTGAVTNTIFVPWYKYLPGDNSSGKCVPVFPKTSSDTVDFQKGVILVALAVVELLTRASALVAVGFVLYGAFQYITSQGDSQGLSNAKSTIANALVGFVLVVLAIGIVQFLARVVS